MASVLYVANTTDQSVAANGQIALGSVIRRTGCSQVSLNGNTIQLEGTGYFEVTVSSTFTSPAATSTISVALYQDGVQVPGAEASDYISTADTIARDISFTCVVRNTCCKSFSSLTLINIGAAASFNNVAVVVKRIA